MESAKWWIDHFFNSIFIRFTATQHFVRKHKYRIHKFKATHTMFNVFSTCCRQSFDCVLEPLEYQMCLHIHYNDDNNNTKNLLNASCQWLRLFHDKRMKWFNSFFFQNIFFVSGSADEDAYTHLTHLYGIVRGGLDHLRDKTRCARAIAASTCL